MCIHGVNKHHIDITRYKPNLSCAQDCEPLIHIVTYLICRPASIQAFSAVKPGQCFVYRASGISTRIKNYFRSAQVDLSTGMFTVGKNIQKQFKRITMTGAYRITLGNPVVQNRVTGLKIVN